MIVLSNGQKYSGWQETFIRTCLAMAREGVRYRELTPRGKIEAVGRCNICQADCYFLGEDIECGKLYEVARVRFCANCENFEIITDDANYAPYSQKKFLPIFKQKVVHMFFTESSESQVETQPCPICGSRTVSFSKDLGGIDYYDNFWTVCVNPFCDWPGEHREEFEWGPYTPSAGPHIWPSKIHRYQSVFISYSTKDQDFTERIYDALSKGEIKCWYAPHEMRGGKTIREQVVQGIRQRERLLLILSESSMCSEWVHYEIAQAKARERSERRRILFPISLVPYEKIKQWELEDDETPDLAKEVRKYYIPDFSNWRDEKVFEIELEKLIEALTK